MGRCATAKLMYGYHLWDENEWAIEMVKDDEYGVMQPATFPWLTNEQVEDWENLCYNRGLEEVFEERLLAQLVNFHETNWRVDGYHRRLADAKKRLGIRFVHHGYEYRSVALVAGETIDADWGETTHVDPVTLTAVSESPLVAERLSLALEVLTLRPKQARPAWLLTAYYG